jgi:biopolymer transport protein ExbB
LGDPAKVALLSGLWATSRKIPQTYPQILWIAHQARPCPLRVARLQFFFFRILEWAVFAMIQAGGWPMWPLLFVSVIAVALIIERLISLRHSRVVPRGLIDRIIADVGKSGVPPEMVARVEAHSPLGRVLAAGLRNIKSPRDIMKEAIEETGRAVVHDLERFLTTLGTIASISPLLGLFGTVVGMIHIFAAQGMGGANMQELSAGVSEVLYTTGFGLTIAIPSTIFWRHFHRQIDNFVIEMEQQAIALVEVAHGERRR